MSHPIQRSAARVAASQPGGTVADAVEAAPPRPLWVMPIRWHLALFGVVIAGPPVFAAGYLAGRHASLRVHDLLAVVAATLVAGVATHLYGNHLAAAHRTIQDQVRELPKLSEHAPLLSTVREANETMAALVQAGRLLTARTASLRVSEERFRGLVDDAPVGIFRTDAKGLYTYVNARWTGIVGGSPDQLLGDAWTEFVHSDDQAQVVAAWDHAISSHAPFTSEYRCLTPDQRTIWVHCHAIPEADETAVDRAPTTGGYIGTLTNITGRRHAEIARDEVEDQLRHAIEAGRMGIWEIDLLTGIGSWDAYLYRMFGLEPHSEPITPDLLRRHVVAEDLAALQDAIAQVAKTREPALQEFRIVRPDGEQRWLVSRGNVVATQHGLSARMAGVTFDITDMKRQQEKQALLIGELSHRVKNTLAVLEAIAVRSLRAADTPEAFVERFTGRLHALADAHSLLTDTDWDGTTLRALITQETSAAEWQDQRVTLTGPDVMLKPEPALALALVLHELTTNAIKYGALSGSDGHLDVRWSTAAEAPDGMQPADGAAEPSTGAPADKRLLAVVWTERCGVPINPERTRGFGSDLIERSLGHGLGGHVERTFGPSGVTVRITLPLV
jgi:PAS domain S-box-containing protein